ncbi:MAG: hypothetical protein HY898_21025 [Deltaproteobacteria bacterium]|nr:hypothetical protein [Deltaproteobacteria bacterium]
MRDEFDGCGMEFGGGRKTAHGYQGSLVAVEPSRGTCAFDGHAGRLMCGDRVRTGDCATAWGCGTVECGVAGQRIPEDLMKKAWWIGALACSCLLVSTPSNAWAVGEGDPGAAPVSPAQAQPAAPPAAPPAAAPGAPPPGYAYPPPAPLPPPAGGEEKEALKHVSITANPLSIIVTRYSLNLEYMLAMHHGLILVPSIWKLSASLSTPYGPNESRFDYYGAELGYHFYTGERGANGFFVGPSFVYMNVKVSDTTYSAPGVSTEVSASSSIYGFAVDFGGQHVTKGGFTIGGGGGVMWVKAASKINEVASPTITVSGVMPRFLFTIGYSF